MQFVAFEIRMVFTCKYPKNETLLVVNPVPPKAKILEVWVWVISTKIFHSYIGGYVLKYLVKYIVIPSNLIRYIPLSQN